MPFLNHTHQQRFDELISRDNTHPRDNERRAMFYIFAGNRDLSSKVNHFYDFQEHCIIPDHKMDLSSGTRSLLELAFNLYNGHRSKEGENVSTVIDIFAGLDTNNFNLALNAIKLRFNRHPKNTLAKHTKQLNTLYRVNAFLKAYIDAENIKLSSHAMQERDELIINVKEFIQDLKEESGE